MKNLIKSLRFTLVFCVFISISYIFVLWLYARITGSNNAETVTLNGKVVGAANVGQMFTQDIYFWGRPSKAGNGYDASSSAGSNKGPTNEEYLAEVESRIDTFTLTSNVKMFRPKWLRPVLRAWIPTLLPSALMSK